MACLSEGLNAPLAVGSRLPLDIELDFGGTSTPVFSLRSVNPEIFDIDSGDVLATSRGVSALLVMTEDGEAVLDFIHLWVEEADSLRLQRIDPSRRSDFSDEVELVVGDSITIGAALAHGSQALLGDVETTWSVEGDAISILRSGVITQRDIVARQAGETTLTVSAAGLSTTLMIRVLP